MQQLFALNRLQPGKSATVVRLSASGPMRRRLMDIGLVTGTSVTCAFRSPAGDPVAFDIRGAVIALRAADAETVFVSGTAPSVSPAVVQEGVILWA